MARSISLPIRVTIPLPLSGAAPPKSQWEFVASEIGEWVAEQATAEEMAGYDGVYQAYTYGYYIHDFGAWMDHAAEHQPVADVLDDIALASFDPWLLNTLLAGVRKEWDIPMAAEELAQGKVDIGAATVDRLQSEYGVRPEAVRYFERRRLAVPLCLHNYPHPPEVRKPRFGRPPDAFKRAAIWGTYFASALLGSVDAGVEQWNLRIARFRWEGDGPKRYRNARDELIRHLDNSANKLLWRTTDPVKPVPRDFLKVVRAFALRHLGRHIERLVRLLSGVAPEPWTEGDFLSLALSRSVPPRLAAAQLWKPPA